MPNKPQVVVPADSIEEESILNFPNDPILAPSLPTSPSRSRVSSLPFTLLREASSPPATMSENDPLLGSKRSPKKPFYRPRPMWIVPFAILASISRGMTIAPRVEVFTQLSCNSVYGHTDYNHTRHDLVTTSYSFHISEDGNVLRPFIDSDEDDNDDDPMRIPTKRCLDDPAVQSGAARIQMYMTTIMGTLSALTTGWWGHFGEKHGRTRVLAVSTLGLLFTDLIFILVSIPRSPLAAHGHKLLVLSPFVEGLLGGWSSLQSGTSAYISDCTSDGSRAHIFSRFMGVFYVGFALGPMLGAYVITHPPSFLLPLLHLESSVPGRTVTPVFCLAVIISFINFILSVFVFPESLYKKKSAEPEPSVAIASSSTDGEANKTESGFLGFFKNLFVPLMIFSPRKRANGKDWSMTLLAVAVFGYLLSSGIFQVKYLYAGHVYGWEAERLSYYITLVGGVRALHLLFLMPFIISICKPKPKMTSEQLHVIASGQKPKPTKAQLVGEMQFDLLITRFSLAVDLLSHTLVSFSSTARTTTAQIAFIGFTLLNSLGSSALPSIQSLALCTIHMNATEDETLRKSVPSGPASTGSLFGALAVLQASGQMILGPMIFGLLFSSTVARFPKSIFTLAAIIIFISLSFLSGVRPRRSERILRKAKGRVWAGSEIERGRSRVSKNLNITYSSEISSELDVGTSEAGSKSGQVVTGN